MTDTQQIVIIGAGHNGLVCAAYLARAGTQVTVVEAADAVGGAAITRAFADGFKVSAAAHLLHLLDPRIEADLALSSHGLRLARADLRTVALAEDGDHLVIDGDSASGAGISESDQSALAGYRQRMSRYAGVIEGLYQRPPPRLAPEGLGQLLDLARVGLRLRFLGRKDMRDFMRIVGINIYDVLEENFEHALLKGALAFDAVLGNRLGPRSNNTVFNALHRMSGKVNGKAGAFALPAGGMGSVSDALRAAAEAAGARVMVGSPVSEITLDGNRARGVRLESGEELPAAAVISSADPRTTFLELLGARNLEAGFASRVNRIRDSGITAKLHLALNGTPRFTGLEEALVGDRLLIAPDMDYVERAFNHSKYGRCSTHPTLEITVPSVHDDSLAPTGQHVLSAVVQYAPRELKEGWDNERERFQDTVIDLIARYVPDIRSQIVATELLSPADVEREFRIGGGHWHHGELTLDQAFMLRPVPGAARYTTPVGGLYLCGAGCHPGGGVMGAAGRNAAEVVLKVEGQA